MAALLALAACGGAPGAIAPSPQEAERVTDELLATLAARFGEIQREPAFEALRPRLLRGSLVPSRVHKDSSVWATSEGERRRLVIGGEPDTGGYRMGLRPLATAPARAGEYRVQVDLERLRAGEYEWRVRDELGVGGVRANGLSEASTAIFRAAEAADATTLRGEIARLLPRSAAAFGRLVHLEQLRVEAADVSGRLGPGKTVTLGVRLVPEGIRQTYPKYAQYLARYVIPMQARVEASDSGGGRFWELEAGRDRVTLRVRVHDGSVTSLTGALRRLPDRFEVKTAFAMKSGRFRVGLRDLVADVRLTRAPHEKSFTATFTQQPEWELPFLVQPLLRGPLRRPFQGEGSRLRYAIVDGAPTLFVREYRLPVRESWILRWLGGMSGSLVDAFRAGAEAEADRFSREGLSALREDIRAWFEARR